MSFSGRLSIMCVCIVHLILPRVTSQTVSDILKIKTQVVCDKVTDLGVFMTSSENLCAFTQSIQVYIHSSMPPSSKL